MHFRIYDAEIHGSQRTLFRRNVLISADNVVKLLDLDAAKHYHPDKDKDTITLGTVGFAAPEQYGVGASSVQTDIYSIGALINVMLCGELPSVRMAESPLSPIIRTCLAVNPSERYHSVEELMEAIRRTQNPTPESTYAHSWQNYLPPGCRSLRPIETALSSVGYALIIWMGATYEPSEPEGIILIWMERILFSLTILGIAFLSGNYLNIQSWLPLTRSKNIIIKLFGILVYDLAIITLFPMIAGIIKGFFLLVVLSVPRTGEPQQNPLFTNSKSKMIILHICIFQEHQSGHQSIPAIIKTGYLNRQVCITSETSLAPHFYTIIFSFLR